MLTRVFSVQCTVFGGPGGTAGGGREVTFWCPEEQLYHLWLQSPAGAAGDAEYVPALCLQRKGGRARCCDFSTLSELEDRAGVPGAWPRAPVLSLPDTRLGAGPRRCGPKFFWEMGW